MKFRLKINYRTKDIVKKTTWIRASNYYVEEETEKQEEQASLKFLLSEV